jgi:uncharacterized membrane protein YidH (DUF202 family)
MQEQIARVQSVFYVSLFIMLVAAVLSATAGDSGTSSLLTVLTLIGAVTALAAKIRRLQIQRSLRRQHPRPGAWAMW